MFKKIIILLALMAFPTTAFAQPAPDTDTSNAEANVTAFDLFKDGLKTGLEKLPSLQNGVAYSVVDSKINYLATARILETQGVSLEAGYAGDADNTDHKAVAVLSYNIGNLEKLGVKTPILKDIGFQPGIYAGFGDININDLGDSEFDYGVSATVLEIKF